MLLDKLFSCMPACANVGSTKTLDAVKFDKMLSVNS